MRPRRCGGFLAGAAAFLPALLLSAGTVRSEIAGSAHDFPVGTSQACAVCHVPTGALAGRLWPARPGTVDPAGPVGSLCGACHGTTGGYAGVMGNAASDEYVFHENSHGRRMNASDPPWSTNVEESGLPHTAKAGTFECTTCHDPHSDPAAATPSGHRPFLRESLNGICARCHAARHFVGGRDSHGSSVLPGAWGGEAQVGMKNPGSHPVGTDIGGDNFGGGSSIAIPARMKVLKSGVAGGWSLGGHLTANSAGGVTCVSCHAVHGAQIDPQDATEGQVSFPPSSPNQNLLVIAQPAVRADWTNRRAVANGDGGFNALCEGCHGSNPGAKGTWSHPLDDRDSFYDARVTAFPANWPAGGGMAAGTNVNPVPICESCHTPHPAAVSTSASPPPRPDVAPGAKAYLLRDIPSKFCADCHSVTIEGHHPVGTSFDAGGVTYLLYTRSGGTAKLTCGTCHNGSGGAHNWAEPSAVGMDNSWKPRNNGRDAVRRIDMYNPDMSKTCMDCHYAMDGDPASVSPTLGPGATAAVGLEADFQPVNNSMGTHYIGLIHKGGTGWRDNTAIDIFDTGRTWKQMLPGYDNSVVAPGWSRFGGKETAPVLVCESCHELEPERNVGGGTNRHLLLARYGEGNNGNDGTGDANGHDVLCEACHGVPPGTHPLTGGTVGTGSVHVLSTTAPWIRKPVLGYVTLGTNELSCDSCHQPHDANTESFTFILDAPAAVAFPSGTQVTVAPGIVDASHPEATTDYPTANGTSGTYATPTLQGKGGSFMGFCDQCHKYAY